MPRRYTLGRRAASVAETRRRILDAAMELYQEKGVSATSMLEVARRADVAPGTVANHFGTPRALAAAVADRLVEDLRAPGPDIFDALHDTEARVRRLAQELADFYERSEPWYRVYAREGGRVPAWEAAEVEFFRRVDELIGGALGALADDGRTALVTATLLDPGVLGGLRGRGLSADEAGALMAEVIVTWIAASRRSGPRGHRKPRAGGS